MRLSHRGWSGSAYWWLYALVSKAKTGSAAAVRKTDEIKELIVVFVAVTRGAGV